MTLPIASAPLRLPPLAFLSAFLLLLFGGVTDRLIPLYAVGVFASFTLSQAGMVVRTAGILKSDVPYADIIDMQFVKATLASMK